MAGRKVKYTTQSLLKIVKSYQADNPNEVIKIDNLVKYSGIAKDTWYRNREVTELINQLNNTPIIIAIDDDIDLPSVEEIFEKAKGDEMLLRKSIHSLLEIIVMLKRQADKGNIEKLIKENHKLRKEIEEKNQLIDNLRKELDNKTLDDISKMSKENIYKKMNKTSFVDEFKGLFE